MKFKYLLTLLPFACLALYSFMQPEKRIGIIGLDTSHSPEFIRVLNSSDKPAAFSGYRVVAAYPYGSKKIKSSYERIPGYTEAAKKYNVEIVNSIAELLAKVDYVMLETNDGNLHLEQAAEVFKAGKPVFIDKPLGASLPQAIAITELSKKYNVPFFSSSSLRYVKRNQDLRDGKFGKIIAADCYSPAPPEPTHPDFSWYGIHGVEMLFTVMGTGCKGVSRVSGKDMDVVTGIWDDGRVGTFRGKSGGTSLYGGTAFTKDTAIALGGAEGYEYMLSEILKFFNTGIAPVLENETLEIFTFMEASNESKRCGGKIISMSDTFKKGQKQAKALLSKINDYP